MAQGKKDTDNSKKEYKGYEGSLEFYNKKLEGLKKARLGEDSLLLANNILQLDYIWDTLICYFKSEYGEEQGLKLLDKKREPFFQVRAYIMNELAEKIESNISDYDTIDEV